ncbi:MAG: acetate/propionate family kinase [Burkholderiaceae bacterium]|nr:acetate/propionate family kinase [Burkholderiaceae bacterium]
MKGSILAINSGSSSVKFASFDVASGIQPQRILHGEVDGIGSAPRLLAWEHEGAALEERLLDVKPDTSGATGPASDHEAALDAILAWLDQHPSQGQPLAAAHRVVHGGEQFTEPTVVTPEVLTQLGRLDRLAPLHQPHNLAAIRAIAALQPGLPQIACFDTAFHAGQAWVMRAYALPQRLSRAGVKRYGFHGLSYEYIASILPAHLGPVADGKVVVAHLGNGASLCALLERRSVATSMGFTALDGLMMGTRCGHLDPGVVLYLMAEHGMTVSEVETMLYQQSGLLGVSGISSDMRTLEASPLPDARAAIDLYVCCITRELGALAATLGGIDALVFTGGIGEHSATIRQRVCREAEWLGVELDETANLRGQLRISSATSRASAWAIPTNEEWMLVKHAEALLGTRAIA